MMKIPQNIVSTSNSVKEMIVEIFRNLQQTYEDQSFLCERAILTPLNKDVDSLNVEILKLCPGEPTVECYSADSVGVDDSETDYPMEFLNSLCPTALPPHKVLLKVGAIVMARS